jgi:hypothetical protein
LRAFRLPENVLEVLQQTAAHVLEFFTDPDEPFRPIPCDCLLGPVDHNTFEYDGLRAIALLWKERTMRSQVVGWNVIIAVAACDQVQRS